MPQNPLHAISIFVRVAETKSFTKAAKHLGISTSGVSKSVTRLEERLGVRLVNRTTRSVSLTDDGATFFERCCQILGELEDAETAVTRRQTKPRGRLRVQLPVGFGLKVLAPYLAQFAELYPELVVDVEFSSRVADLAEEGIDVVVRIGDPGDTRLVARKLCDICYVTVASPGYIARYGEPKTPDDLQRHRCLGFYIPQTNRYRDWSFISAGHHHSKSISGNLNMNSGQALLDAAIAGAGIATVGTFMACDAVRAGLLRIVLREYVPPAGPPIWLGYLERRHLSLRIRAFVDFLTTHIPLSSSWDTILDQ
ncbi:MAG: hypothetical protein A3F74_27355 [Betaproteobacteria bacterium RIFCSPLOWO2_12_FULL_62_58]|nr:MAG: hypothetical protein A3F74_27355 [Betaproteobacteria bacterium RIFCSPLOWO2_12_FULL_62_58]